MVFQFTQYDFLNNHCAIYKTLIKTLHPRTCLSGRHDIKRCRRNYDECKYVLRLFFRTVLRGE